MTSAAHRRCRVLLFEDDPSILETLTEVLELEGYEVHGFPSPVDSPLMHSAGCPCAPGLRCCDVIITDLAMPKVSGLDLIEHLERRDCPVPRIAVVSGQLTPAIRQDLGQRGVEMFEKPSLLPTLTDWLRECAAEISLTRVLLSWSDLLDSEVGAADPHRDGCDEGAGNGGHSQGP